jgi:hypothetical protein
LPCASYQDFHQAGVDPGLTLHDPTDGLDQFCERAALQKDTGGAIVECAQHDDVADAAGDHKDGAGKAEPPAPIQELSAGLLSKVVVEQDKIDLFLGYDPEGFFDRGARSNDSAFRIGFEQPT